MSADDPFTDATYDNRVQMSDLDRLRRLAIVGAVLAAVVSVPANLAFFAAFGGDPEAAFYGTPNAILGGGPAAATLLRWGAIGDIFYSYLLLLPLALFIHRRLREKSPWLADIGLVCGFAYIFAGAAGAAILAIAGSALVDAYSTAASADQAHITTAFDLVRNIVFFALWQLLDVITLGTWIMTTGLLLLRDRPVTSRLLIALGGATVAASGLTILEVRSLVVVMLWFAVAVLVGASWGLLARSRLRPAPRTAR